MELHTITTSTKLISRGYRYRLRTTERRTLLLIGDLLVSILAILIALYFWAKADLWLDFSFEFLRRTPFWFYLLPLVWTTLLVELYDEHQAGNWKVTVQKVATAGLVGLGLYLFLYFFSATPKELPRRGVAIFFIVTSFLTLAWRFIYIRIFTTPEFLRRVLLVGVGETGQSLLQIVHAIWPPPFYLVGIIDDDPNKIGSEFMGQKVFGGNDALLRVVHQENVSEIIVAISGEMQGTMFQALIDAQECGVTITRMPVAYEELMGRVPIRHLEADWILRTFVDQTRVSGFFELGKRLLDVAGGMLGCLILLVILPFVSIAILIDDGWPVFYRQVRSGRGDQPYNIIKFRTMKTNAEPDGSPQWAEEKDPRATRVGRILRKTHIDEIPQFVNVLYGEMSLVGPRAERPELVAWFQKYVPFYRARLLVKPGITGWAQVNFGYASTIEETMTKLEYDLYYIKHRSILLDLVILLRTPATIFGLRGR